MIGLGGRIGDDLHERLEELFGEIEPARPVRADAAVLPDERSPVRVHTKQSDQAHLIVGSRSYAHGHPDRYAVQLLSTVLGGGMSSRLFTEVRERRGLAYYVYAATRATRTRGRFRAGRRRHQPHRRGRETIVAELRRIVDEPVPAEELEKARAYSKGRFVLGLESPHGTIMFGLRRELLEGQALEPAEVLAGLDAVTAEDVQRVAPDILGDGLRLALIGPFDEPERFEPLLAA